MNDTICAMATPQGGAISVIRISGEKAIEYVSRIFAPRKGLPLAERKTHTVAFGDISTDGKEVLDEVLVTIMRAPYSYTGEESVEISCHASSYITQQLLLALLDMGARQAAPGEFTMRAFMNGKMDLSSAEAVADLIASNSRASHRLAMNQLKGGFSNELGKLRDKLLKLTSLLELELDFGEEDVTFAPMLDKNMCPIDWTKTARQVHAHVRGLHPWPVATAELGGTKFKIHQTVVLDDAPAAAPGTILGLTKTGLQVACGSGAVEIRSLQAEGGKRMAAPDYFRGHPLEV